MLQCCSVKWVIVSSRGHLYKPRAQQNLGFSEHAGLPLNLIPTTELNNSQIYFIQIIYFDKVSSKFSFLGLRQSLYLIYSSVNLTTYQRYSKTWHLTREMVHALGQFSKMFSNCNESTVSFLAYKSLLWTH